MVKGGREFELLATNSLVFLDDFQVVIGFRVGQVLAAEVECFGSLAGVSDGTRMGRCWLSKI